MSRIQWRGDEWLQGSQPAIDHGLYGAAQVFADVAVRNQQLIGRAGAGSKIDLLSGSKIGRLRPRRRWIASQPGQFPGVRTSLFRSSIVAASPAALGTPGRAAYGSAVGYGRYLQTGTSRMAARPWATLSIPIGINQAAAVFARTAAADLKAAGRSM